MSEKSEFKRPAVIVGAPRMYSLRGREPNVQNIPVKSALGREIREAFKPEPLNIDVAALEYALTAAPVRPHPIVKLGAEIAAEIGPAEAQARRELGRLAARWAKKTTRPLLVSADLRAKGALWRITGEGAC